MRLSKPLFRLLAAGALATALLSAAALLASSPDPILIQSLESRTVDGAPVFNRIAWFPGSRQDTWMMQQSHSGLTPDFHPWDRLAIVVDKTRSPKVARFYQLQPGQLRPEPGAPEHPYRASCFMCHSNGPRAIRPDFASSQVPVTLVDRVRLLAWNLRIQTYGRVVGEAGNARLEPTPFRFAGAFENETLRAPTCLKCHNDSWWGRGRLTRQNGLAISFMVEQGLMPPPGFSLGESEKKAVMRFVKGLPEGRLDFETNPR